MAAPKIQLVQSTPGSWTHIDILVNGTKQFHASKQGTHFWVIVNEDDRTTRIGSGMGRPAVRAAVKAHLAKVSSLNEIVAR